MEYKPYKVVYVPFGTKKSKVGKDIQEMCRMNVEQIKRFFRKFLVKNGYKVKSGKEYIFAKPKTEKQETKTILTAHMDTVQDKNGAKDIFVETLNKNNYLWSPNGIGGDDRCGLTIIKRIIEKGYRPTILLCDKEETGGVGSTEFAKTQTEDNDYYCIIELDRQGSEDLVFYDEDNEDWKTEIKNITNWKEAMGTFSDICNLYDMGIASVNISVGYYKQHTQDEYIILENLERATKITEKLLKSINKKWKHKEKKYRYPGIYGGKSLYDFYNDYEDYDYGFMPHHKYTIDYIKDNKLGRTTAYATSEYYAKADTAKSLGIKYTDVVNCVLADEPKLGFIEEET